MSEPTAVLCRYFVNGCCTKGEECPFSHDRRAPSDNLCRYYLKGGCFYGDKCRYDHVRGDSGKPGTATPGVTNKPKSTSRLSTGGTSKLRANAPEFVPRTIGAQEESDVPTSSYAGAVNVGIAVPLRQTGSSDELCPYFTQGGTCYYGDNCSFPHGQLCEFCLLHILHPIDQQRRQQHIRDCVGQHEEEMELAFLEQGSVDKACGICMETVWEKSQKAERRFGILQNCKHVFCLDCIRKWRSQRKYEMDCIRACPECRAPSDFITPSAIWTDDEKAKTKIIANYKKAMNNKACKHFDQGKGECPFGNKCFYKHALPNGVIVQGDSPRTARNGEGRGMPDVHVLWDFMDRDGGYDSNDSFEMEVLRMRFMEELGWSDTDDWSEGEDEWSD